MPFPVPLAVFEVLTASRQEGNGLPASLNIFSRYIQQISQVGKEGGIPFPSHSFTCVRQINHVKRRGKEGREGEV